MYDFLAQYYEWIKVAHIVSVISWMAAMFYLPRLFVYHTRVKTGSEAHIIFVEMERKLLRIIMNPAMIATYIFGFMLTYIYGMQALGGWFHVKFTVVILLSMMHGIFAKWRRNFAEGKNTKSEKFYRVINEVPVIFMIIAVIMVIVKPFE